MILLFSSACSGNNSPIHLIVKERSTSIFSHFTVVRATELSSNIMHIFQDSKNLIWLGSWKDGLYSFDGKTLLHYKSKERHSGYRVHEIKEDKKGNIIVNTELGIFCHDRINFTQIPVNNSFENNWRLSDQDIWLRSANEPACIYRYDGQTLFKLKIPACPLGEDYQRKKPSSLNPYDVYYTYIDSQGFLWLGTSVLGAMRYNGIDFQWISEPDVNEIHDGPSNGVRSIIEDSAGYFWFNTEFRYKIVDKSPLYKSGFYQREKSIGSLNENGNGDLKEYLSITKDKEQSLWIATYLDGVWKYKDNQITHYPIQQNNNTVKLFYIYTDNTGTIWLGSQENGLYKFNGKSFEPFYLNP